MGKDKHLKTKKIPVGKLSVCVQLKRTWTTGEKTTRPDNKRDVTTEHYCHTIIINYIQACSVSKQKIASECTTGWRALHCTQQTIKPVKMAFVSIICGEMLSAALYYISFRAPCPGVSQSFCFHSCSLGSWVSHFSHPKGIRFIAFGGVQQPVFFFFI